MLTILLSFQQFLDTLILLGLDSSSIPDDLAEHMLDGLQLEFLLPLVACEEAIFVGGDYLNWLAIFHINKSSVNKLGVASLVLVVRCRQELHQTVEVNFFDIEEGVVLVWYLDAFLTDLAQSLLLSYGHPLR